MLPEGTTFLSRRRSLADNHEDPMQSMGSLFDVAVLIGVGFLIVALSGFGLKELISDGDVTIVKNPGTAEMEIIQKRGTEIERLTTTDASAAGYGQALGTVYQLEDGRIVWVEN